MKPQIKKQMMHMGFFYNKIDSIDYLTYVNIRFLKKIL